MSPDYPTEALHRPVATQQLPYSKLQLQIVKDQRESPLSTPRATERERESNEIG